MLDLTPIDVPLTKARPIGTFLVIIAGLALILTAIVAAGVAVFFTFVMPETDRGRCLIFDSGQCSSLSALRIEEVAEVDLPSGSEVVESGSSRSLKGGATEALVRLPAGAASISAPEYTPVPLIPGYTHHLEIDAMRDRGVTEMTGLWGRALTSDSRAKIVAGVDDEGTAWVYIFVGWDG